VAVAHAHERRFSIEEFVRLEQHSNVRHELLDGQIFAMGGGTRAHGAVAANVIAALAVQLRGQPCQVHTCDVRIRVIETGLDTYPDVSVVCGKAELDREDPLAVTNTVVLVEVLSPSTAAYDQGEKLSHYQRIPSLREVVFVDAEQSRLIVVRREGDGWTRHEASASGSVALPSIGCALEVDEVLRDPLK
jgi:Uma2 family endonuclease